MKLPDALSDPVLMRRVNGWLAVGFLILIPVAAVMTWLDNVQFVSYLTLWGLVVVHLNIWQLARVEVRQVEEDIAADVVREVIDKTEISRSTDGG